MTENSMGDEVYQPQQDEDVVEDMSPLESPDSLENRVVEPMEEGYSPPEKPLAVNDVGTTAAEQRDGESLDERLAREVPEDTATVGDGIGDLPGGEGEPRDDEVGGPDAGRLVAPDEGAHEDTDAEAVANDVGFDSGARTAEEAAVHVVPDDGEDETGP
ncbi:DUF5709 domain-containing protein [Streptomyces sp. NPDC003753]|uniref:DUF5709 domain-containing protein n=1 Tax=unclassified Streptomyces TaxID=2593676 RepID=UPI001A63CADF|nr:DUF5709 domain-containing protein [Streptomyces sp. Y2F8-2]GHK03249.1 hypothetical protein SY2F82_50460 [Streptomyces sp. Y2F8-2]